MNSTPKSIFVCTFCQLFSADKEQISHHVLTDHTDTLPEGAEVMNFVSKLQPLTREHNKLGRPKELDLPPFDEKLKLSQKRGRPRKIHTENVIAKETVPLIPIPHPREDGLFWCEKCEKCFVKSRQLCSHVCHQKEESDFVNELSEEFIDETGSFSSLDTYSAPNFKRRSLRSEDKNRSNTESSSELIKTAVPNWRDDPSYIPLFANETEKKEFENHVKSIDYSCVDNLFTKIEKLKKRNKDSRSHNYVTLYLCNNCSKCLPSLDHIRMHCLTHTHLRPFICPRCDFTTNSKGSLYSHIRIHLGSSFACSMCPYKTTKRRYLLEHEQTHSAVPQHCKMCKNSYKTPKSLIAHVRKYHEGSRGKSYLRLLISKPCRSAPITCHICQMKFISQVTFDMHNKNEHSSSFITTVNKTSSQLKNTDAHLQNENENISLFAQRITNEKHFNPIVCLEKLDILTYNKFPVEQFNGTVSTISKPIDEEVMPISQNAHDNVQVVDPDSFLNSFEQDTSSNEFYINDIEAKAPPVVRSVKDIGKHINPFVLLKNIEHKIASTVDSMKSFKHKIDPIVDSVEHLEKETASIVHSTKGTGHEINPIVLLSNIQQKIAPIVDNVKQEITPIVHSLEIIEQAMNPIVLLKNIKQKISPSKSSIENITDNSIPVIDSLEGIEHGIISIMDSDDNDIIQEITPPSDSIEDIIARYPLPNVVLTDIFASTDPSLMLYSNIFQEPTNSSIPPDSFLVESNNNNVPLFANENSTEANHNEMNLDIIGECFESSPQIGRQSYDMQLGFGNQGLSLMGPIHTQALPKLDSILVNKNEQKSVENKLFEKCQRAPAYVCCVCSNIYICQKILKAHLREHVSSTLGAVDPEIKELEGEMNGSVDLEGMCNILQDNVPGTSGSSQDDRKLEQLYSSSSIMYLPEVSVVLNDCCSLDDVLLDLDLAFPLSDKYDESENLSDDTTSLFS